MNNEPVIKGAVAAALTTLVTAGLGLLVALGVDVPSQTQGAILGAVAAVIAAVGAVAPLVTALFAREKVTPLSAPKDAQGRTLTP